MPIKMWDMYLDLKMASREDISHLIVEVTQILIDIISDNSKFNGNIPILVHYI